MNLTIKIITQRPNRWYGRDEVSWSFVDVSNKGKTFHSTCDVDSMDTICSLENDHFELIHGNICESTSPCQKMRI